MIHTRCPHCQTTFRVTDDQLSAALGTVRCGPCSHIFSATECQLLPAELELYQKQETSAPVSEQLNEPVPAQPVKKSTIESSFESTAPSLAKPATAPFENRRPEETDVSEEAATDDINEMLPDNISSIELIDDKAFSDSFKSFSLSSDSDTRSHAQSPSDEPIAEDDDKWAEALLDEDNEPTVESVTPPVETTPEHSLELDASASEPSPAAEFQINNTSNKSTVEDEKTEEKDDDPLSPDDEFDPFEELMQAIPGVAEQELAQEQRIAEELEEPKKKRTLLWCFLSLVALFALASQLAFFNFDRLAVDDRFRPAYQLACETLKCELPVQQNIDNITSSGLSIRPHAKLRNALSVDLILTNNAIFTQPFPNVRLDFSDLNQKPVASRVFKPDEYLNADFDKLDKMPIAVPIHLSFEIKHPGAEATNFSVKVVP